MRRLRRDGSALVLLFALASVEAGCGPAQFEAAYQPMTVRGQVKRKGPPPMARLAQVAHMIQFETNKAALLPDSFRVLDEVGVVLQANPQVGKLEVQGHTDSVGKPQKNLALSQARAEAVVEYLVSKGIPAARLEAKGYGQTQPVADNETEEGRAKNRRVAFKILEQQGE